MQLPLALAVIVCPITMTAMMIMMMMGGTRHTTGDPQQLHIDTLRAEIDSLRAEPESEHRNRQP
jgi:hypothetical protein